MELFQGVLQTGMSTIGPDTFIERAIHRDSIDSKVGDIVYNWAGHTTEEEVISEEESGLPAVKEAAPNITQNNIQAALGKENNRALKQISFVGNVSLDFDLIYTPPNSPSTQRQSPSSTDTNLLTLENLLLPAVLQRRLSRISVK